MLTLLLIFQILFLNKECKAIDDKPYRKPNVIIIYTDDQAQWTIGAYRNKDVHTPNMDRLASEGMLFTQAFTKPVCSPSRAMLLTGLFSHKVGIPDYISYPDSTNTGLPVGTQTIASLLRGAGYSTGLVGKWHLGYGEKYYPTHYGFDHAEGYRYIAPDKKIATIGKIPFLIDGKEIEGFHSNPQHMDILADRAINFIRNQQKEPFFLYLSTYMPHQPWDSVPKIDQAYYENKILTVPNLSSFPEITPERATTKQLQNITRKYYANVTCVDRNIGRVLDELDQLGLTENTIVIFIGDNGYMAGQHGLLGKGNARNLYIDESESYPGRKYGTRANMFDNSVLVPFIIRWPGVVKSGTLNNALVSTLDILPTLSEINGITTEDMRVDGKSLLPLLGGNSDKNWRRAYYDTYDKIYIGNKVFMRMIRTNDWKLVLYEDENGQPLDNGSRHELFSLRKDPEELKNIYGTGRAISMQKKLESDLRKWMHENGLK